MASKKTRKRKKKSAFPMFVVIILIAAILTFVAVKMLSTDIGVGTPDESVTVDIPEGSNVNDIAEILEKGNVIDSSAHFRLLCKLNGEGSGFKFGSYTFEGGSDFYAIADKLNKGDSEDKTIHITVKEGMWLSEIATLVEEEGLCSADEFMKAANSRDYDYDFVKNIPDRDNILEGYLYPETYYFMPDTTAYDIVDTMLKQFDKVCTENDVYNKVKNGDKSLDEVVTIASLVESEVKIEEERPVVASVIYNRLKEDMKLQIDASVIYSLGERVSRVYYKDLENTDNHNTYYVKGLPEGPICSPRAASLLAAVEPANTDYIYYVVEDSETGKHYFTADYDDFLKASEKYKSTLE